MLYQFKILLLTHKIEFPMLTQAKRNFLSKKLEITSSGSELSWSISSDMSWLSFTHTSATTLSTLNVQFNCNIYPVAAQMLTGSFDVSDGNESTTVDVSSGVQ